MLKGITNQALSTYWPYICVLLITANFSCAGTSHVYIVSNLYYVFPLQILAEPLLQLAVTVALLSLPLSVTPALVVWIYDKLLWLSEPIWLTVEAVGVVYITVTISRKLVQRMDKRPGTSKVQSGVLSSLQKCAEIF